MPRLSESVRCWGQPKILAAILAAASALQAHPAMAQSTELAAQRKWLAVDVFHTSRTLPSLFRMIELPINPGVQVRYHSDWLHGDSLSLGGAVQAAVVQFDQLFWAPSVGVGVDSAWRPGHGIFAGFGLRLDYAHLFTGSNHFEDTGERYEQTTDTGRGYLRGTLTELLLGYSPVPLERIGIVPALRYAWTVELPLYANEGGAPWSYTQTGISILWLFEGARP